ncbi:MAG: histidine kinase [Cyclobacteriaceae bacterium]|nr:histidine kinase [Cyclobacteriaceae bacterium]
MKEVFNALDIPILILDKNLSITFCNDCFKHTFQKNELQGSPLTFFSPDLSQACASLQNEKQITLPILLPTIDNQSLFHIGIKNIQEGKLLQFFKIPESSHLSNPTPSQLERLQSLFTNLSEGILFVDQDGKCVEANPAAALITEYTQPELRDMHIVKLIYSQEASDKFKQWISSKVSTAYQFESVWVTKTAKLRIIQCQLSSITNSSIRQLLLKDITEEKKTLAELYSKSVLVDAYFQSSTDSIFLLGKQAKILGYNKVAANFIQVIFNKQIQIGESILNYASIEKRDKFLKHYYDALSGIKFEKEIKINHPKLSKWWILRYDPIITSSGEVIGISFNGTDITSRKEAEMELLAMNSQIRQNEANMASIVNNTSLYIWSVDREFKLLTINNALRELLNNIHQFDFAIGQRMIPLFSKELPTVSFINQWIEYYMRALHGEAFKVTQWINEVFYEFSLNPIIEDNRKIGVSVFAIDRTNNVLHEREVTQLNQQISELQLQTLRSAMNPHFIFNAFNSIQYFISRNDRLNAINYLSKFSKLVRGILSSSNQTKIRLSEELNMIQNYIEIEQIRFENKFEYYIKVDEAIDLDQIQIYPLLIQPYVENAILHGLYNKSGNGKLIIQFKHWKDGIEIEIEDNGVGREKARMIKEQNFPQQQSMGMKITESRLRIIYKGSDSNFLEIVDLFDDQGHAAGTRCVLRLSAS